MNNLKSIIVFLSLALFITPLSLYGKVCRKGIACGNTCIAAWKTCHVGAGTAVNASDLYGSRKVETDSDEPAVVNEPKASDSSITYKFRSEGSGFFLIDSSDNKILRCEGYCSPLVNLPKGGKVEFLDGFKIIEFQTITGPHSCEVRQCKEIAK